MTGTQANQTNHRLWQSKLMKNVDVVVICFNSQLWKQREGGYNTLLETRRIFPTFLCQGTKVGLERKGSWELLGWFFRFILECLCPSYSYYKLLRSRNYLMVIEGRDSLCYLWVPVLQWNNHPISAISLWKNYLGDYWIKLTL